MLITAAALILAAPPTLAPQTQSVSVAGKRISVTYVRASLRDFEPRVALAKGQMGRVEELAQIAKREKATVAINGCFFEAYTDAPVRNIDETIIKNGRMIHLGRIGCVAGFTSDGQARIDRVRWRLEGARNGNWTRDAWHGYWINRKITSPETVVIYTPEWGSATGESGPQIVVSNSVVQGVQTAPASIPRDGFVVVTRGPESRLADRVRPGQFMEWRPSVLSGGDPEFWGQVTEAIGCGPMLLEGGKVDYDPTTESFSSPKILSLSAARSALGLTAKGEIVLAVTTCTVRQLADVMRALNCTEAMNLDGGASSGLVVGTKLIRKPGRPIANALILVPRRK